MLGDLRYAVRTLARKPGFTAVATLTLALGIGANTAIFSVVNAVLLQPLPFPGPDQLVMVRETTPRTGAVGIHLSPASFALLKEEATSFENVGAYDRDGVNLAEGSEPEHVEAASVSSGLLAALGVSPALGRLFRADEDRPGHAQVALVSHRLWRRRFGSDPDLVGRTLLLGGTPHTVVGIMPRGFEFPVQTTSADLWLPLDPAVLAEHPSSRFLRVVGRLKPGLGPAQVAGQMQVLARRLQARDPRNNDGLGLLVVPLRERIVGGVRTPLQVLLGAVGVVLLIACANVASLLLARAATREREFAIRTALGASRPRLVRQLLTEGFVLASLGGVLGCLTASWALSVLVSSAPADLPRLHEVGLDGNVLAFTLLASVLSGVAVALAPAAQASRAVPQAALRDAAGPTTVTSAHAGLRGVLVVAEIALALPLVIAAGLFMRSFMALRAVDPGFRTEDVLTARLTLPRSKYATPEAIAAVYRGLLERLATLPGVAAVGISTHFPFQNRWRNPIAIEGRAVATPADLPLATVSPVMPGYFTAMGISLKAGRSFTESDSESAPPVVVIDEVLAQRFFSAGDALEKRLKLGDPGGPGPWLSVVGVVRAVRDAPDVESIPEIYLPFSQIPRAIVPLVATGMTVALRSAQDPLSLAAGVRGAVRSVDPGQPVFAVATLDQLLFESRSQRRFQLTLLGLFGGLALLLACVGLYGVVSYQTAQRTREIGLRMALGAGRRDVLRLVVGQVLKLVATGVVAGLAAALSLARVLSSLLFGVGPTDPLTFVGAPLLLVGAALLATYLPAHRAARVDPLVALRCE